MLILSRRVGERIMIPAMGITIVVQEMRGQSVRIGLEAPDNVVIYREEILDSLKAQGSKVDHGKD